MNLLSSGILYRKDTKSVRYFTLVGEPVEVLGVGDYRLLHEDPESDATEQALRL